MKPIAEKPPLEDVKKILTEAGRRIPGDLFHRANSLCQIYASRTTCAANFNDQVRKDTALLIKELMQEIWDAKGNLRKANSKNAADKGHAQAGGSRDKRAKLLEIYLRDYKPKGKKKSECIEKERGEIGMSASTGEKALRNK